MRVVLPPDVVPKHPSKNEGLNSQEREGRTTGIGGKQKSKGRRSIVHASKLAEHGSIEMIMSFDRPDLYT